MVEKAPETASMMLGSDKSRGYCLEMICADFLAGASVSGTESQASRDDLPKLNRHAAEAAEA